MGALTLCEIIAAGRIFRRSISTLGKAQHHDLDAMKFVARWVVPMTCVCSYLVWAAFLYSSHGIYCPGKMSYVDTIWVVLPILTNLLRIVVEEI